MDHLLLRIGLEAFGIARTARQAHQVAVRTERPAMVHAHEGARGALALAADQRAAVRTGVEQRVIVPGLVAREQDRAPGHLAGEEAAGFSQF